MKDVIIENLPAIITAGISLVGAITAFILSLAQRKSLKIIEANLEQAKERGTYSVCPHCGKKIYLQELTWHLANGCIDNNLDGVED